MIFIVGRNRRKKHRFYGVHSPVKSTTNSIDLTKVTTPKTGGNELFDSDKEEGANNNNDTESESENEAIAQWINQTIGDQENEEGAIYTDNVETENIMLPHKNYNSSKLKNLL